MTNQCKRDKPAGSIRISHTVKEGEPTLIDGVIVEVRRKRRHGGQYRVIVHSAGNITAEVESPESRTAAATVIDDARLHVPSKTPVYKTTAAQQ